MENNEIWIASSNQNKVSEFRKLLPEFQIKSLLDLTKPILIAETGDTFAENALIKAKTLGDYLSKPTIADDSGISIEALNGFPGVFSKRWAAPITDDSKINELLLKKLNGIKNRNATMETVLVYYDPKSQNHVAFSGTIQGKITLEPRGNDNFGYDEIFEIPNKQKTLAELGEQKHQFSHRQIAVKKFIKYYQEHILND